MGLNPSIIYWVDILYTTPKFSILIGRWKSHDEVQPISERKTFSVTGIRTRGGSEESCPWSLALDPSANQPHIWKCFWPKWNWKFFEALQLTSTVSIRAKSVVHFSTFPRNNPETSEWKGRVRFSSALSAQNERKLSIFTAPKKSL